MQNTGPSPREGTQPDDNMLRNPVPSGRPLKSAASAREPLQPPSWHVDAGQELGQQPAPYSWSMSPGKEQSWQPPTTSFTTTLSFQELSSLSTRRAMRVAEAITKQAAQDQRQAALFTLM